MIYLSEDFSLSPSVFVDPNTPIVCYESIFGPLDINVDVDGAVASNDEPFNRPTSTIWTPMTSRGDQYWLRLNPLDDDVLVSVYINNIGNAPFDYCGIIGNFTAATSQPIDNVLNPFQITLRTSNNNLDWTDVFTNVPASDAPMMFLFDNHNETYIAIDFYYTATTVEDVLFRLSHLRIGKHERLIHPVFVETIPIRMNETFEFAESRSEMGHFLGRSQVARGMTYSIAQERATQNWVRTKGKRFYDHFNGRIISRGPASTFFCAWRPEEWPNETAYCHPGSFSPFQNYMNTGLMKFQLSGSCE